MRQIDDKIIDKIRKLLALGQSPNENEAKLAIANAQKLLMKHNLIMSDIENIQSETDSFVLDSGSRVANWKCDLAYAIAEHNYCRILIQRWRGTKQRPGKFQFVLIGKAHNVVIITEMYKYLVEAIDKMAVKSKIKGATGKNSYRLGVVEGIKERLLQIKIEAERNGIFDEENGKMVTSLVVQNLYEKESKLNDQFINNKFGKVKSVSQKQNIDPFAFSKGISEANNIGLNQQIQ